MVSKHLAIRGLRSEELLLDLLRISDTFSTLAIRVTKVTPVAVTPHITVVPNGQHRSRVNALFCRAKTNISSCGRERVDHRFGMSVKNGPSRPHRDPAVLISGRIIGFVYHGCGTATVLAFFCMVDHASMKTTISKVFLIPQKDHIGSAGRAR